MTSKDANHESEFAKSTRELLSALRKEIECPVCLSELEQPCSLPCNHFYCRECVERALQLNNGDCPLCKAKFTKRNIMDDAALLEFVHSFRELYSELEKHSALNLEPLSSDQKLSDVSKFRFKPLERTNKDNDVVNWVPRPRSAPVKLSNSIDQNEIQTTTKNPEIQDFAVPQGNSLLNTSQESRVSVDFVDEEKPILSDDGCNISLWSPYYRILAGEIDEDPCHICLRGESAEDNPIVFCSKCNVSVHQSCYGIENIPEDDWFCDPCLANVDSSEITCAVCPSTADRAFKSLTRGRWIHCICALWLPEVQLSDSGLVGTVKSIDSIDKDRYDLICSVCKIKSGACLQCGFLNCLKSFHVPCGIRAGFRFEVREDEHNGESYFHQFCMKHASRSLFIPSDNHSLNKTGRRKRSMSKSYDSDISIQRKHPKSRKSMDSYSRGPSKSISILPTKLRPEQKLLLSTFKKAFPVNVAKSYDDSVTHVITCAFKSSGAHLENRTMKYLLGLVGWLQECIKQGQLVDEAEFEIKSDSISAIPCLSERLEKNQKLFENCIFFLEDESNSGSSELYILLKMCGAEILPSESVCFSKRKLLSKRVYLVGNVNESIKQQLIGLEISFSEVDASWIYDCICLDSIVEI